MVCIELTLNMKILFPVKQKEADVNPYKVYVITGAFFAMSNP